MIWEESIHMCERVRNSMATTGCTTSPFENFYGEKPKIIGLFSEFGNIGYVTKRYKLRKKMTDKTFKAIMVGYTDNHTRDTPRLYNPDTTRVIMTGYVKWADWKITDPAETLKMFHKAHKQYVVPSIEGDIIPTSEPEYKMPVNVIPD